MLYFQSGVLEAFDEYFPPFTLPHSVHLAPESLGIGEIDGAAAKIPVAPGLLISEMVLLSAKE